MGKFEKTLKEKFGINVAGLAAWTDNTLPNIESDLIANSDFLSMLSLESGLKGTREIALLSMSVPLKAKAACTPSPDGSVVLTKKNLSTVPLYQGVTFCNESLNSTMYQVLNTLGMKMQNGQLPADLEVIVMSYLLKMSQKKAQDLVWLGLLASGNPDLVHFAGLNKQFLDDAAILKTTTTYATVDSTNAYSAAVEVYKAIPADLLDSGKEVVIFTGRTEALNILAQYNAANPYTQITPENIGGSLKFLLPLTNIYVQTVPQLNGLNLIYAFAPSYVFLGVDSPEDQSFDVKYNDYTEELKAEASFRLGVTYVFPQYIVKLKK
jgi:hypothetical protein